MSVTSGMGWTYRAECTCGWVSPNYFATGARARARSAGYGHELDMEESATSASDSGYAVPDPKNSDDLHESVNPPSGLPAPFKATLVAYLELLQFVEAGSFNLINGQPGFNVFYAGNEFVCVLNHFDESRVQVHYEVSTRHADGAGEKRQSPGVVRRCGLGFSHEKRRLTDELVSQLAKERTNLFRADLTFREGFAVAHDSSPSVGPHASGEKLGADSPVPGQPIDGEAAAGPDCHPDSQLSPSKDASLEYDRALADTIRDVITANVEYVDEFDLCSAAVRACEPIIQGYAISEYASELKPRAERDETLSRRMEAGF